MILVTIISNVSFETSPYDIMFRITDLFREIIKKRFVVFNYNERL